MSSHNICKNCGSNSIKIFLDLGKQPNGNVFVNRDNINDESWYDMQMGVCHECWQVQLLDHPPVEDMFVNHPYITGLNKPVLQHFQTWVDDIVQEFNLETRGLVLDIGANDGSLLKQFRQKGFEVLGIDPCLTSKTNSNDIEIISEFWSQKTALKLKQKGLEPKLITASAVFYHIEDIHDFVLGVKQLMTDETIFCTQCINLNDIINKLQYDQFYHEHTFIHSLTPLKRLFEHHNLKLLNIKWYPIHGGSFVLYIGTKNSRYHTNEKQINNFLKKEKEHGLLTLESYFEFSKKVEKQRAILKELLIKINAEGKTVVGLGAPLKSSTLLNYCGIDSNLVKFIVEINPLKIGKLSPGTHIPIISEDDFNIKPDYFLLLTWNFKDHFINKYNKYIMEGVKMIIPNPEVKIIDNDDL